MASGSVRTHHRVSIPLRSNLEALLSFYSDVALDRYCASHRHSKLARSATSVHRAIRAQSLACKLNLVRGILSLGPSSGRVYDRRSAIQLEHSPAMQEIVLCATAASSSSASSSTGPGCIALHDLQTGNSLASFKQTNAPRNSTAILESTGSEGGFMLSCQPDKSILNVYNFQKVCEACPSMQ